MGRGMTYKFWTAEEIKTLRELKAQGQTDGKIGQSLGRTGKSVNFARRAYKIPNITLADIHRERKWAAIFAEWRENVGAVADGHDRLFTGGSGGYKRRIQELVQAAEAAE